MDINFHKILPIINFVLAIACLSHIIINAYNILFPEIPSFKAYEKELGDIEFPVSVKLCVREIYNVTKRYEDYGYKDARVFFFGHSYMKEGYVGWNGNFENGSLIHVKGIHFYNS